MGKTFSIVFWNIWLDNQIKGVSEAGHLLSELRWIVEKYNPDFIGLNEVLQHKLSTTPFVSDFLSDECGYTDHHYAYAAPFTDDWLIGVGLYSRYPFKSVADVAISNDTPAVRRGYEGYEVKAITAKIKMPDNKKLNIIVAHPMHLRKHTLKDHFDSTSTLEKLIRSKEFSANTILGGDFNEPGFVPKAFRRKVRDVMHFRTGSKIKPTWRHNARRFTPIRANLDQMYWSKDSHFRLKSFKVISSDISDHRPILATFEY